MLVIQELLSNYHHSTENVSRWYQVGLMLALDDLDFLLGVEEREATLELGDQRLEETVSYSSCLLAFGWTETRSLFHIRRAVARVSTKQNHTTAYTETASQDKTIIVCLVLRWTNLTCLA